MVKRYSAYANNTHAYEDIDGVFVKYKDYAALANVLQALYEDFQDYITTTEMELKELREKLGLSS